MKRTRDIWARLAAGASAGALALTVAAPPALADNTAVAAARSGIAASASARVAGIKLSARAQSTPAAGAASTQDGGFFRSRKGVIAIVLTAGVLTWTAISRSKDAVRSPARN